MLSFTVLAALLSLAVIPSAQAWKEDSTGCTGGKGFTLDRTGHVNRTLASGRTYLFHLPSGYNASNGAHPLVLSFHGGKHITLIDLDVY